MKIDGAHCSNWIIFRVCNVSSLNCPESYQGCSRAVQVRIDKIHTIEEVNQLITDYVKWGAYCSSLKAFKVS